MKSMLFELLFASVRVEFFYKVFPRSSSVRLDFFEILTRPGNGWCSCKVVASNFANFLDTVSIFSAWNNIEMY